MYCFVTDSGTITAIRAMRTTTPGSGGWTEQDSGSRPSGGNDATYLAAVQDGTTIHILHGESRGLSADLEYSQFSLSSNTWIVTKELVDAGANSIMDGAAVSVRSDGDVVVLYSGTTHKFMGSDRASTEYARREAGSWTSGIRVDDLGTTDDNAFAGSISIGDSDRMHFFWYVNVIGVSTELDHRSLSSTNTLATIQSAINTTTLNAIATPSLRGGVSYDSGGTTKLRTAFPISTNAAFHVMEADAAESPTWSESVRVNEFNMGRGQLVDLRVNGVVLHAVYLRAGTGDLCLDSNDDDGGWAGTDTLILDTSIQPNDFFFGTNVFDRSGLKIGIIYWNDIGTTVLYDEHDLAVAGLSIPVAMHAYRQRHQSAG